MDWGRTPDAGSSPRAKVRKRHLPSETSSRYSGRQGDAVGRISLVGASSVLWDVSMLSFHFDPSHSFVSAHLALLEMLVLLGLRELHGKIHMLVTCLGTSLQDSHFCPCILKG